MKMLDGKVAIVTSSTRGIGLASAKKLAENGAKVYFAVRRLDETQKVVDEIINNGGKADLVYFDASKPETFTSFIDEVYKKEGRIDILVNNYGGTNVKVDFDIENTDFGVFMDIVKENANTVYVPTQRVIPIMKENGGGSIINISSVGGVYADVSGSAYATAKCVINFLTQEIAVQQAKNKIRCNAVLPGFTATDAAMQNMSKEFLDTFLKTVPLKRAGTPEDMANGVLFFASEMSDYITGDLLEVAGGFGKANPLFPLYNKDNMR
ncbi:MAG: SDR family NAD(P)-dependent oxidoreductase [Oscillospiraceae bacterium]